MVASFFIVVACDKYVVVVHSLPRTRLSAEPVVDNMTTAGGGCGTHAVLTALLAPRSDSD